MLLYNNAYIYLLNFNFPEDMTKLRSKMLLWLKTKLFVAIIVISAFSLLIAQSIFSYETETNNNAYAQLIQVYKECLKLENETFKMLTFKFSSIQLAKRGYRPNLTMEDNLGKKWIFKALEERNPYYTKGVIDTVVYRVYKLFGIETPEIHPISLNINGKDIYGSIQRYISNKGIMCGHDISNLSQDCFNYSIKAHVLYWLLANYDAHLGNFLVQSIDKKGNPKKIIRVDNDNAFWFLGQDKLEYDYIIPWHTKVSDFYYYRFWKAYISKNISLDLENNYSFIKFVSCFPDRFFEYLTLPAKIYNFGELTDSEFIKLRKKYSDFLEPIILRKRNLTKDFEEFYRDLAKQRGESLNFKKNIKYNANSILKGLTKAIKKRKKEKLALKKAPIYPQEINAVFSFEGFLNLKKVYMLYWSKNYERKDLTSLCNEVLETLSGLMASGSTNEYEKKALGIYIKETKKIRSGYAPSFPYNI